MLFIFRKPLVMTSFLSMIMLLSAPAYAIFAKLTTSLTGTAILNVIPTGKAAINQGSYPKVAAALSVNVAKVNVPDGTVLEINLTDCAAFGPVGYLKVVGGSASIGISLPGICQIGRSSSITINDATGADILRGGPWKI